MNVKTNPSPTAGPRHRFTASPPSLRFPRITGAGRPVSLCDLHNKQQGVALVVAVLVVAIAAVLATALVDRLNLDIRRTENLIHSEQAYVYAQGAEIIATAALHQDRQNNKYDSLDETWAMEAPPFPVEGGAVTGKLTDLQGCFNINNLSRVLNEANHENDLQRFYRLLSAVDISPMAGTAVVDWLDDNMETTPPDGAEDDWYMGLTPPYRAANGIITSISELRMLRGFEKNDTENADGNAFEKLAPYICALPIATTINVNTAPDKVLKSLSAEMTDDDVSKIIEHRNGGPDPTDNTNAEPFETLDQFKNFMHLTLNKPDFPTQNLGVATNYFLLEATAQTGNNRSTLYSIIQRDDNGSCHVIARSQGVW
ncbi:MAG: ral secretion pathway protein [Pseudomonadota bacterium]|nr:ral secretion pathway protein [Pseudomonadota bacterium]